MLSLLWTFGQSGRPLPQLKLDWWGFTVLSFSWSNFIIKRHFYVSGVHKYVLDDRLFARPLYTDHLNNSRCIECHLPHNTSQSRTRETPPITLPSTLRDAEFHVSVPVRSPRGTRPSASGNVLSQKKITHTSGRHRATPGPSSRSQPSLFTHTLGDLKPRAPPPVDSLALRYQKGVAKWTVCICYCKCLYACVQYNRLLVWIDLQDPTLWEEFLLVFLDR